MPAAAVIPAPTIVYIEVVAVKKFIVGFLVEATGHILCVLTCVISGHPWGDPVGIKLLGRGYALFTVKN